MKLKQIVLIGTSFAVCGFSNVFGASNPAAHYCEILGYDYSVEIDAEGNEVGLCTLPDGSKVDAWDFYRGKVKPEFSYCSKYGYNSENRKIEADGYTMECQYCVKANGLRSGSEGIPVDQLMEQNGDVDMNDQSDVEFAIVAEPEEESASLRAGITLPTSFDMRNYNGKNYVNPIRNQQSCGACYAFATAACSEVVYNRATGSVGNNMKKFSESFIMWCNTGSGCNGGYTGGAVASVTTQGICELSYYPFTTTKPSSCTHLNDPFAAFKSYQRITCKDITAIKTAIYKYGAVVARVHASTSAFQNYKSGIFTNSENDCNGTFGHAVVLIGWGTDATKGDYWILRNSWGTSFGESGYMKISVAAANVSSEVYSLIPNPVYYEANNVSEKCNIPADGNVVFIGHNTLKLKTGFSTKKGCVFQAKRQAATIRKALNNDNFGGSLDGKEVVEEEVDESSQAVEGKTIYPNPNDGEFSVSFAAEDVEYNVVVTDFTGKVVYTAAGVGREHVVKMKDIVSGVYFVRVNLGDKSYTEKVIIK